MVEIYVHLASPLHAFHAQLSSGLNVFMKYFSFSFLSVMLSKVHLIKRKHKVFWTIVPTKGNMPTYRDHSEVFMPDVLVMQSSSFS